MDERIKPGQLHETPVVRNEPCTYPETVSGGAKTNATGMNDPKPSKITKAGNTGSAAALRKQRHTERGGYEDPGYGKVHSLPEQR